MSNPIKQLSHQLANQIAAGEVIERPASVVKELIENSIDAGASRIEVDIERGGTRLIRIIDNGHGIDKDYLVLALTRHATSKIDSIDDLNSIQSLGFRGEALASISSVSKLTLTSRTKNADLAWQAVSQGRDMQVVISPASAIIGTRIEVKDLFFNTPARQKFLRTEKTEFNHIEEVFKRQALANPEVSFILKHNGKLVKRITACASSKNSLPRLSSICGKNFVNQSIEFSCQYESIQIDGWLGKASFHRSESDIQYNFINRRPVKDKMLNHAIRESYDGKLPLGRMPAYAIFLTLDPEKVDVNVHPTKHEVRFGEQRLIHDLLVKSIKEALETNEQTELLTARVNPVNKTSENEVYVNERTAEQTYQQRQTPTQKQYSHQTLSSVWENLVTNPKEKTSINETVFSEDIASSKPIQQTAKINETSAYYLRDNNQKYRAPLILVDKNYYITQVNNKTVAINACQLFKEYLTLLIEKAIDVETQSLLFPAELDISSERLESFESYQLFSNLGFLIKPNGHNKMSLIKVPVWLKGFGNHWVAEKLQSWLELDDLNQENLMLAILDAVASISEELMLQLIFSMDDKILRGNSCREIKQNFLLSLFQLENDQNENGLS